MLMVFQFFQTFGFYGFAAWVPTLIAQQVGINLGASLLYSFIIAIASPFGPLLAMSFADRFERKWQLVAAACGVGVFGVLFSFQTTITLLIVFGVLITLCNNVLSNTFHGYQTELFPTRVRARAVGFTYSFSRISTVFASFIIGFFLQTAGTKGVFGLIAFAMAMVVLSIAMLRPADQRAGAGADFPLTHSNCALKSPLPLGEGWVRAIGHGPARVGPSPQPSPRGRRSIISGRDQLDPLAGHAQGHLAALQAPTRRPRTRAAASRSSDGTSGLVLAGQPVDVVRRGDEFGRHVMLLAFGRQQHLQQRHQGGRGAGAVAATRRLGQVFLRQRGRGCDGGEQAGAALALGETAGDAAAAGECLRT